MARRPGSATDLAEITVLALLTLGPRHPYDLYRFAVDTRKDTYLSGLPRPLYHAVDRLAADGAVAVTGTGRAGNRPERTVYAITGAGRADLGTRLRYLLERPLPDATAFEAALALCGALPATAVRESLATRAAALEGTVASARAQLAGSGLPRLVLLEHEFTLARSGAELTWVRGLLADLDAGLVGWPGPDTPAPDTPAPDTPAPDTPAPAPASAPPDPPRPGPVPATTEEAP